MISVTVFILDTDYHKDDADGNTELIKNEAVHPEAQCVYKTVYIKMIKIKEDHYEHI